MQYKIWLWFNQKGGRAVLVGKWGPDRTPGLGKGNQARLQLELPGPGQGLGLARMVEGTRPGRGHWFSWVGAGLGPQPFDWGRRRSGRGVGRQDDPAYPDLELKPPLKVSDVVGT